MTIYRIYITIFSHHFHYFSDVNFVNVINFVNDIKLMADQYDANLEVSIWNTVFKSFPKNKDYTKNLKKKNK